MDNQTILNGLNEDQKKPVLDFEGASFILAGPGAGKTKTIISRTAYMINQGIRPENIILFTFTNKAAKEIKERVISFIGDEGKRITVGTYHSICVRFLRRYAERIHYTTKFTIFDMDDCVNILKKICKVQNIDYKRAMDYISDCKKRCLTPDQAIRRARGFDEKLAAIYREYQKELKLQDAMDFDDLIINTILLLQSNADVLQAINEQYTYITADEFHDSSKTDLRLMTLLAGERQNICMILDPDQSIYGFRGASLESVLGVDKIFEGLKTFVLHRNYRSSQTIVNASVSLINRNTKTIKKELYSLNEEGEELIFFAEDDQEKEALRCVKLIKILTTQFGLKNKDICILYRMGYMSRILEEAFLKNAIPYKIVGGLPFCSRKEIKDILSYARIVFNPYDFEAYKRSIGMPKRGIGDTTLDKIKVYARHNYAEAIDFVTASKEISIKGKTKTNMDLYIALIERLTALYENNVEPAFFIKEIIESIGYINYIKESEPLKSQQEERIANVAELINIASTFDTIVDFLENMSLNSNMELEEEQDQICLMTEHASKGLEFPAVILVGCNEGTAPHYKAVTLDDVEEERRLFYVAMTRAEKFLFFTRAKKIIQQGRANYPLESRFIKEIDKKYLKRF